MVCTVHLTRCMLPPPPLPSYERSDPRTVDGWLWTTGPSTWQEKRVTLLECQQSTGITDPRTQGQENLLMCWSLHYRTSADGSTTGTLFDEEEEVDTYMFKQWLFAYCNTFYAIDNFVTYNIFERQLHSAPRHLGCAWYLGLSPQEIYGIAKDLSTTCDPLTDEDTISTSTRHLQREVNFCIQEITNLQLWDNYPLGYMNIVTSRNYLEGRDEEEARWYSLIPAIIIKRH